MKKLLKWAKPFILILLIICFLTIIVPVTYSYVPQFIKYVFDNILEQIDSVNTLPSFLINFFNSFEPIKSVIIVAVTLVIFQIIRGGLMLLNGYLKGVYAEGISLNMRNKLFRHIGNLSYSYHNNVDSGDLIQRCTSDIETIKGFLSNQLPEILYIFASLISGAIQMASINVGIMLITLCVIPINFIASAIYFKYVSKKFDEIEKVEANMITCIEENVNGARVVKAFANELEEIEKFDKKNTNYKEEVEQLNKAMSYFWGFSDGITILQYAVTIGYCIFLAEQNLVGVGDIVVCISYISMLVYPIRSLGRIIGDFGKSIVAAKRVDEILSKDDEFVINGTLKPEIKGNISFKNVCFKFDDADNELLNNISFDIIQGETIAIVGKTGCGKSTIVHILERMLEYTSGSILIDGVELKDIDKKWLRNHIGIVLQDPFLYNKNILEACASKNPLFDIADYVERVKIVKDLNSPQLLENANRVIRILKDTSENTITESYFKEDAEKVLYANLQKFNDNVDYKTYLNELENLNPSVTKFFDDVLVMDKDENVKKNRLALLTLLRKKYDFLTDFSKI